MTGRGMIKGVAAALAAMIITPAVEADGGPGNITALVSIYQGSGGVFLFYVDSSRTGCRPAPAQIHSGCRRCQYSWRTGDDDHDPHEAIPSVNS